MVPNENLIPDNDQLLFADEPEVDSVAVRRDREGWKLLIVDDEEEIHKLTRLVLGDFRYDARGLDFMSAYTGEEACRLMKENKDIAVILLDVVMERAQAGLEVAKYIRDELGNRFVRIILRTGQPGQAPERKVVTGLDINDYKQKSELTSQKLFTSVTTAIRSYRDLRIIDDNRRGLHMLAMSVAHQVRNRTISIAGFANLASRKDSVDDSVREYLKTIVEESGRLEGMVASVSEYASIQAARKESVNLGLIIEERIAALEQKTRERNKSLECDFELGHFEIVADPSLFVRALDALLANCLDFTFDDVVRVWIKASCNGDYCDLSIQDAGSGIAEEHIPLIFDPFFTLKPQAPGMGLCVVRRVVDEHQWDVEIESEPGKGTVVTMTMPLRDTLDLASDSEKG